MKSLTTLSNEYFNGVLRDFNPPPTVLDVSRYFIDACDDTLYTLVWAGFPYFLREKRGYQLPSSENIIYLELLLIKQEKHKKYARDVELKLL